MVRGLVLNDEILAASSELRRSLHFREFLVKLMHEFPLNLLRSGGFPHGPTERQPPKPKFWLQLYSLCANDHTKALPVICWTLKVTFDS